MRAARRIIVLAGILALAVCRADHVDSGGSTERQRVATITFVKIMCADFGVIPAELRDARQRACTPRRHRARLQHRRADSLPRSHPGRMPSSRRLGLRARRPRQRDPDPGHGGNRVDPSLEPVTGTVALTAEPSCAARWTQSTASEVTQPGFGFGTIRCGTDNRTATTWSFSAHGNDPLAAWPTTWRPGHDHEDGVGIDREGPFAFELTCGDGESTSYRTTSPRRRRKPEPVASVRHRLHSRRDRDGGRRRDVTFAVNGEARAAGEPRESRPDARLHDSGHRGERRSTRRRST